MITHMPTANTTDIICMMTTTLPTFLPMRVCFPSELLFENLRFFMVAHSICLSEFKMGTPPILYNYTEVRLLLQVLFPLGLSFITAGILGAGTLLWP